MKGAGVKWAVFFALCCMACMFVAWIREAKKCESGLSTVIVRLMGVAVFTLFAEWVFVSCSNARVASVALGCYYASIDWLLICMVEYVEAFVGAFHSGKYVRWLMRAVAVVDTLAFAANIFFGQIFSIYNSAEAGQPLMWHISNHTAWFILHLAFTYLMAVFSVVSFAVQTHKTPGFYRGRYRAMLIIFLTVIVLNSIHIAGTLSFDISVFLYCILGMQICYYGLFYRPTGLINKTLSMVISDVSAQIYCFDYWDRCVYANKKALEFSPGSLKEGIAKERFGSRIEENRHKTVEKEEWEETLCVDGQTVYFAVVYHQLRDKDGAYIGCFFTMTDRSEEVSRFQEEYYRLTHDKLTGLYNRDYFFERVEERLASNPDERYLVVCSNLKGFKLYNDLFGVEQGDEVLKTEAEIIRSSVGERTIYGRIGGDEFALLIPAESFLAENLNNAIRKLKEKYDSIQYQLHMYVGVYEIVDRTEPVSVMCDKAKLAIESAQGDYNAVITRYDDKLLERSLYERQIVGEFDRALENREFCMFLQPQIAADGKLIGAEALVRWQHPERGMVYPGDFIDVFERTGLIYRLDKYMWEMAVAKLHEWKGTDKESLYLSVNISARDFYYMDIYEEMTGLVEKYGIAPEKLKLEITETALMSEIKSQLPLLERLRKYGFEIEMDDFGSGYSSLNMLKNLDLDVIKIDMGFLHDAERMERSISILDYIIRLIKQLGMGVITEGVETKEQVERLLKMGCDMFQGYYFAKPMPVKDFEEKYAESRS